MNKCTYRFTFIAISIAAFLGCKVANDPKAIQIIDKMAAVYDSCQSYSDSGSVTTIYHYDDGDKTEIIRFSTAMIRPGKFRFEFTEQNDPQSRYIVWQNGDDVRTWWDLNKRSGPEDSLGIAIAGATGVSGGSAHTIPALLMPAEVGGRSLTDIEAAKIGEYKQLGEYACITIEALYAGDPVTIWIDDQSFLIRRIDSTSDFDDFKTSETTVYEPVVDHDVDLESLEYNAGS